MLFLRRMVNSSRWRSLAALVAALMTAAMFSVSVGSGVAHAATDEPCDIYAAAGTPCVAAYSPARALFDSYDGPLYQVQRASDGATRNIGLLQAGGYADAGSQDRFCAGTTCTITVLYDQTPNHNDLTIAGPGTAGPQNNGADATALPITVAGHKAYGMYLPPKTGYRRSSTVTIGTARNGEPESMYEVASGTNANHNCCSDFGNVETKEEDTGQGHMDALNVSYLNATDSAGRGPWVQGDLENGVFEGHTGANTDNLGNPSKFVTAELKNNGQDRFALKGGNAQRGALSTWYEGPEPVGNYTPMKQEGSIVLGTGGDNSNRSTESFFEGVMTAGYSTDAADNAVQANIVAQDYQGVSTGGGPGIPITGPQKTCVDVVGNDVGSVGSPIRLAPCRDLAADQHWSASAYGDDTLATLGRCMTARDHEGPEVVLGECASGPDQQWRPRSDGTIENLGTHRCLRAGDGGTGFGSFLQLSRCTGGAAEQFRTGTPIHHAGKCVDVSGDDTGGNGTVVQLWTCQTLISPGPVARDQQWTYDPADQTLRSLGRCLTPDGGASADGTHLQLYDCGGAGGQQWIPRSNGTIVNPQSGRCLDDPGGSTANGTHLQISDCTGDQEQIFDLN